MRNKILLIAGLQLFMVFSGCSSDSGDTLEPVIEPVKGEIKADYISEYGADDFVVDNDGNVFFIGQTPNDKDYAIKFQKIDKDGKLNLLKGFNDYNFLTNRLSVTPTEGFLLISRTHQTSADNIFRFENNFSELKPFYAMKAISSPYANKIELAAITGNDDNTYFVYDYKNNNLKRAVPELATDALVAGSGKKEIKDGTGLEVGFGYIEKIISQNKVLYFIDNLRVETLVDNIITYPLVSSNIRKVEFVDNQWKVTTIVSTTNIADAFRDITFDSKDNFYVLKGKGIYKLNLSDNTFLPLKEGEITFAPQKNTTYKNVVSIESLSSLKIKNNDLYLGKTMQIIKISDFQSKFDAANK